MKIVYILTRSDEIGGAQIHVRDLAQAMRKEGHEPLVVVGGNGPLLSQLRERGVRCISISSLKRPIAPFQDSKAFVALYRILRVENPDLVSLHSSKAGLLGRLAAKLGGVPAVFTAHGWAFTEGVGVLRRRVYTLLERLAALWAAKIITVSEYDYQLALRSGVGDIQKLKVIHNGMPDLPEQYRARPETTPCRLIMVARFSAQKDHASLFKALHDLADVRWTLELIGGGPDFPIAQESVATLGLQERVEFTGEVYDVPARLAGSSLFVLISKWEGLPRSIIEAMRAGLPVVASDVGGVRELVEDGVTGYLIPSGDVSLLRQRLQQLIDSPALRQEMGLAGRRRFEKHFQFEAMFQKTLAIYKEVLDQTLQK